VHDGRTHILMITNHGLHEWQVTAGLPDTGGQNVYVNHFSEALVDLGYEVTIVNRGGYLHPHTEQPRLGTLPHAGGRARIVYLEDGHPEFVRKEDMGDHLPALAADLVEKSAARDGYDLIISHYWDGGLLGALANDLFPNRVPHLWIPHSLGALKKRNMDPGSWAALRIDERIEHERDLLGRVDGVAATSQAIRRSLEADYGHRSEYFLPPGVDDERYRPRTRAECSGFWERATFGTPFTAGDLAGRPLVTEVSRTDRTKRKQVLIEAFARVREEVPDALLAITIDEGNQALHDHLLDVIAGLGLEKDVLVLGSVWDLLPCLYSSSDVYCTPSIMEGFGMSAQEAAATGVPVVATSLVPFVTEYLLGRDPASSPGPGGGLLVGEGAIVAPADSVEAFAAAITLLLGDADLRLRMGEAARSITVPSFTWRTRTAHLMTAVGVPAVRG